MDRVSFFGKKKQDHRDHVLTLADSSQRMKPVELLQSVFDLFSSSQKVVVTRNAIGLPFALSQKSCSCRWFGAFLPSQLALSKLQGSHKSFISAFANVALFTKIATVMPKIKKRVQTRSQRLVQ